MKSKSFLFYTLSGLILGVLVLTPMVAGVAASPDSPSMQFFQEWLVSAEQFVVSQH